MVAALEAAKGDSNLLSEKWKGWYARGLQVVVTALYTPERAEEASDRLEDDFLTEAQVPDDVNNFMTAVGPFVREVLSSDCQQLPKEWKDMCAAAALPVLHLVA